MPLKFRPLKSFFGILLLVAFIARPTVKICIVGYHELTTKSYIQKYCVNKNIPTLNCNEKYYLKKQLEFGTPNNYSDINSITISEVFTPVYLHLQENYRIENVVFSEHIQPFFSNTSWFQEPILHEVEYPPEFI